jgi:hypothetical protein
MKEVALPIELANALLQYLGTRPYHEVFQLIAAMQEAAKPNQTAVPNETP